MDHVRKGVEGVVETFAEMAGKPNWWAETGSDIWAASSGVYVARDEL